MSMLAERKKKTKWVINPTKKPLWTKDSSGIKIGKGIMEKMGWTPGKGLGVNEQGIQEPLRVSYKNDTQGMGFKGNDNDWIEHQNEFNCFLNQLRSSKESFVVNISDSEKNEIQSLEEKSKWSKARVHYQKFTRGKDLSKYSENDLACILGTNKINKEKSNTKEIIEVESKTQNNYQTHFGITTINSGSIQDYFKKEWIFSNKNKDLQDAQNFPSENSYVSIHKKKNFQKEAENRLKKGKIMPTSEEYIDVEETVIPELDELKISKKKERKKKREKDLNSEEEPDRKRRKRNHDLDPVNGASQEITYNSRSKKKKFKHLLQNNEYNDCDSEKLRKKYESDSETKIKELDSLIKKKKKKNDTDYCFQDLHVSENQNNVNKENDTYEKKLKKKKKKEKEKEALTEKKRLEIEHFSSIQNSLDIVENSYLQQASVKNTINYKHENNVSEPELILKKKNKKFKKEKYSKNEIGDKDSCYTSQAFLSSENKAEVNESCLEVEFNKKKKKKKDKKKSTEKDVEYFENSICEISNSNVAKENDKNKNERDVSPEERSVIKQKKKKDKEKLAEKKEIDEVSNHNQIIKLNPEEGAKNSSAVEVISEVKYVKKKTKKKKSLEKDIESLNCKSDIINFCVEENKSTGKRQNSVEDQSLKETKMKKSKKERLLEVETCNNQITDSLKMDEKNVENSNKKELSPGVVRKEKKQKGENEKLVKSEKIESVENCSNQITNLSKVNEENVEITIEKGLSHKVELVNKKKKKKKDRERNLVKIENAQFAENCYNHVLKPKLEKELTKNANEIEVISEVKSVKKKGKIKEVSNDQIENEKRESCAEVKETILGVKEKLPPKVELVQEREKKDSIREIKEHPSESIGDKDNKRAKKEEKTEKMEIVKKKLDFFSNYKNNYSHEKGNCQKYSFGYINDLNLLQNKFGYNKNDLNIPQSDLDYNKNNLNILQNILGCNENNLNSLKNNYGFNINNYLLQQNNHDFLNHQNNNMLTLLNFLYSYNLYNNLLNLENGITLGRSGIQSHKVELLNEKRADKIYPGQNQSERVLRLIQLSDFTEFKGSNLEKLVGYGCQNQFIKNKPK